MAFDLDIEGMVFEAARDGAGAQGSASAPGRERAVAPTLTEDDLELDFSLRPKRLDDYLGQTKVKESLGIMIAAAQGRGEPADHILFSGPPGLGKTTRHHGGQRAGRLHPYHLGAGYRPHRGLGGHSHQPRRGRCCSSTRSIA